MGYKGASDHLLDLVDVSDIFYFFLLGGGERGAQGAGRGRGDDFFSWKIPGGGVPGGWAGGAGGCLRGIWAGGLNIFFRGRNSHQVEILENLEILEIVEILRAKRPLS